MDRVPDEYLTAYPDSQRDGVPMASGILSAIANAPLDVGRLYVHLIGNSDAAETIRFSSGETLTASALDAALDALQTRQACAVVLAVDAPHSGSFLPICRATGAQQRVAMAGSRASDTAFFLSWPVLSSFSQKYLGSAYQGNHLKDGYSSARNFFATFLLDRVQPQMDDNGDGVSDKWDGDLAKTLYLGRRYAFAGDDASGLPFVLDVTSTQTVRVGAPVRYTARLVEGIEPTRVFAQLAPAAVDLSSGPVSSLREIAFTRDGPTSWTWSATFAAPHSFGLYRLAVYGAYPDGTGEKLSEPAFTAIEVTGRDIMVAPASIAFGVQDVNAGPTIARTVTIRNDGAGPLQFVGTGISITGQATMEFRFASGPTTTTLAAGASRMIEIVFDPSVLGYRSATLNIATNDGDESEIAVPLTGTGSGMTAIHGKWILYR